MFGLNFNKEDSNATGPEKHEDKNELERFFEDEDWEIGNKGGEVDKDEDEEVDWSNYDFMHTFDELSDQDSGQHDEEA